MLYFALQTEEFDLSMSGTTITLALINYATEEIWISNIGNSMCYMTSLKDEIKHF